MSDFQPLIDFISGRDFDPRFDGDGLLVFDVIDGIWVNVNGPGYWSDGDDTWGATVIDGAKQDSVSVSTVDDLMSWLEDKLNSIRIERDGRVS
jgi:hypothetical protein